MKLENLKSSLPSKRFTLPLSTTLNKRKLKLRWKHISCILPIFISATTNRLHIHYVNIASYESLKKIDIVITKPDKENGVVTLDQKLYNIAIQEIIFDTSKFEKLNEKPTWNSEASLQRFLRKLKQKNFFD